MRRHVAALLTLLAFLLCTEAPAASITYNVVNYPSLQAGFTVSGTITTNGTTGVQLPISDITSWNITITNGTLAATLTPANTSETGSVTFDATPSAITVASSEDLILFSNVAATATYQWRNFTTNLGYSGTVPTSFGDQGWANTVTLMTTPVAITSLPEPTSAVLAVIGAGAVVAFGLARHCRAKCRQTAAWHTQPTE
jgi:hypothetical protein